MDRNHVEPHMPSRRRLIELKNLNVLVDIWRNFHTIDKQYTWVHAYNNLLSLARLDRFYGFKHQFSLFRNCSITPVGFSDHSLVVCSFSLNSVKPKSAYWHFNTALLEDKHFKEVFSYFWKTFKKEKNSFPTLQQWWDMAKVKTKQLCQQYTLNVTRNLTVSQESLETEIMYLQNLVDTTVDQTKKINSIEKMKSSKIKLNDLLEKKAQGALIRSRFRNVSEMDAPSKFFFGLEQKNGQRRLIHALRSESGFLLTKTSDIRKRATEFYSKLFRKEYHEKQVLSDVFLKDLPKLSEDSAERLDRALTLEELHAAVMGIENGRSAGIDGLPAEFYKSFWSVIGQDLLDMLNASVAGDKLPLSCRRAVLTLVPKKGDLTDLKQWRPLSLLCIDSRIFSKTLATRLGKVMAEITHVDQTYCVPGRSIFDNIFLIRDTLDVCTTLEKKLGLLFLDQEKAFDRVEHIYLWKVLEAFGFNPGFLAMIKVLYSEIESLLKVNGGLCAPFKVDRGIRQGCSLSGMLYALSFEPLLHRLRAGMSGVVLNRTVLRLSAYADDLAVMVNGQQDIDVLNSIFKDFKLLSSATVNWAKSEAILVGDWLGTLPKLPDGLIWKRGGFKYLGVFLGDAIQKNWDGAIEKIKGRLNKWRWLLPQLSYRGRCLIINNLVASFLWHKLMCLDPPPNLLAKVQALLIDFFWDRLHWVPQSVLYLPREEGGQGVVHLSSRGAAFRLHFIQRLLTGPENLTWRGVACEILHTVGGLGQDKPLFLMDPSKLDTAGLPVFYKGLFKVWNLFKVQKEEEEDVSLHWLLSEPVINGARLDITCGTAAFNARLCQTGTVTLHELVDICGPKLKNVESMVTRMGLRSMRVMGQILQSLRSVLRPEEHKVLKDYGNGLMVPDTTDPFPKLLLIPKIDECEGSLLFSTERMKMDMDEVSGKTMYRNCVKVLNKKWLSSRVDTPWRSVLMIKNNVKPEWKALYKLPLTKRMGDLQWRVLHGIVAMNSFIAVLNPEVTQDCPFCSMRETVFHAFLHCLRLCPLFDFLHSLFQAFDECFFKQIFILGFKYCKTNSSKGELINFILGNAKMAVYISRKNKIDQESDYDVLTVLFRLLRSRVQMDFKFYKSTSNVDAFESVWCYKGAVCSVINGELVFAPCLL